MELNKRAVWLSIVSLLAIVGVDVYVFSLGRWYWIKAFRLHILAFIEFVFYIMCRYVWRRLSPLMSKEWLSLASLPKLLLLNGLVLALGCIPLGYVLISLMGAEDPPFINRVTNSCLGILLFLTTSLVGVDVCAFILRFTVCWGCGGKLDSKGRNSKMLTLLALLVTLVLLVSGQVGVSRFAIEHVRLPVKNLDPRLNGTTMIQLSDIHLGPFNGRLQLLRIIKEVNKLNGDVVVITGDLVDSTVVTLRKAVKPLTTIKSKYGVYYSPG